MMSPKKTSLTLCLFFVCFILSVYSKTLEEWKTRTTYQILTDRFERSNSDNVGATFDCNLSNYCGGTYKGIQSKLDYISKIGFNAIWISPIVQNIDGGYHGYWLSDLWKLNPHFGSEQDFKDLIQACHERDIWVMIDVVMNHVGPVDMDFSRISPFNQRDHYHPKCQVVDFQNQTQVEYCRLANLPDLDQENSFVYDQLTKWISQLIHNYNIDGIRIDTVPYVSKDFWRSWKQQFVTNSTVSMGEVFDGRVDYVAGYANIIGSTLSYPLYFTLRNVFANRYSMYTIRDTLSSYKKYMNDPSVLGIFIDNHDNERFLHYQPDYKLYQNALTYVLFAEGLPIIYYGTEQGFNGAKDPQNREPLWSSGFNEDNQMYNLVKMLVQFRNQKINEIIHNPQIERYASDHFYAFTRGNIFVATCNVGGTGSQLSYTVTYHPYAEGTVLCNLFYPSDCVNVSQGKFNVVLLHGESKVFYPKQ